MSFLEIEVFRCLTDNYGVLIHDPATKLTAAIDAPDHDPICRALRRRGWKLTHILTTHHHEDHVAANLALQAEFGAIIIGPAYEADRIPGVSVLVADGDIVNFGRLEFQVIETPGHTTGHVCYYCGSEEVLFAGDTLFALGCGRLLEGNAKQMWHSLEKLLLLPDTTNVFFGHDYAAANAMFALSIEPQNVELQNRAVAILAAGSEGISTCPTRLGVERRTNPLLRASDTDLKSALDLRAFKDEEIFAVIRRLRDNF